MKILLYKLLKMFKKCECNGNKYVFANWITLADNEAIV